MMAAGIQQAAELLREMNIDSGGDPFNTMHHYDGWVDPRRRRRVQAALAVARVLLHRPAGHHSLGERR
jgi:hypothetical protein